MRGRPHRTKTWPWHSRVDTTDGVIPRTGPRMAAAAAGMNKKNARPSLTMPLAYLPSCLPRHQRADIAAHAPGGEARHRKSRFLTAPYLYQHTLPPFRPAMGSGAPVLVLASILEKYWPDSGPNGLWRGSK